MLAMLATAWAWTRATMTGSGAASSSIAIVLTGLVVAGVLGAGALGVLKLHDTRVANAATQVCETRERADRLAAQLAAEMRARQAAERQRDERTAALSTLEADITRLEHEKEDLRRASPNRDAPVFAADDPWFAQRLRAGPKAAP